MLVSKAITSHSRVGSVVCRLLVSKVAGYTGLLLSAPTVLYEVASFVIPGLTKNERQFLGPIVFGSSGLFYGGYVFVLRYPAPH